MKSKLIIICLTALSINNLSFSAVINQVAWHKAWNQDENYHEIGFMPVTDLGDTNVNAKLTGITYDVLIKRNVDQSKNIIRQVKTKDNNEEYTRFSGFIPEVNGSLLMDMAYVMYEATYDKSKCSFTSKIKFFREDTDARDFFNIQPAQAAFQFKRLRTRNSVAIPYQDKENIDGTTWGNTELINILTTDNWACTGA